MQALPTRSVPRAVPVAARRYGSGGAVAASGARACQSAFAARQRHCRRAKQYLDRYRRPARACRDAPGDQGNRSAGATSSRSNLKSLKPPRITIARWGCNGATALPPAPPPAIRRVSIFRVDNFRRGVGEPGVNGLNSGIDPVSGALIPFIADFPANGGLTAGNGSVLELVLGSLDQSQLLDVRLSQLETEQKIKIVSRPKIITRNNQQAVIKSVDILRVRLPGSTILAAMGWASRFRVSRSAWCSRFGPRCRPTASSCSIFRRCQALWCPTRWSITSRFKANARPKATFCFATARLWSSAASIGSKTRT